MLKRLQYFLGSASLILGCVFAGQAQEISNVQIGYVPEIKRFEVFFDLDSKQQKTYDLRVYVQEYPNGARKQVDASAIHGLNLSSVSPGFNYYFQIDAKGLNLPPSEYVFQITPSKLDEKGEFKVPDTTQVKVVEKPVIKKPIIQPIDQSFRFMNVGISPIALGGEQSNLTLAGQFGVIRGWYGYAMTLHYGLAGSPSTGYTASNEAITNYTATTSIYKFTKEVKTTRLSVVPAFLFGLNEHVYLRAGVGYGARSLYWSADEYNFSGTKTGAIWAQNSFASQSGVEVEGGLNLVFKRIHVAGGINYLGLFKSADSKAFSDLWIGFGLNF
ncbi:hypothetical protein [Aquirufa echingensis]|jgi:hypothetical protein|uniref:Outer membrane protein beta-barrel domain-containing protein n=1 Tax=Aquirufa echingensis TaxID=3096516 RepID=A0ABW6CX06_9BACT